MAIPNVNLAGLRLEISHFNCRSALKDSISSWDDTAAKISSTWMEKIMVPVGEVL